MQEFEAEASESEAEAGGVGLGCAHPQHFCFHSWRVPVAWLQCPVSLCVSLFAVQLVALAKRAFTALIRISAEDDPELAIRGTNRPGVTSAIPVGRVC